LDNYDEKEQNKAFPFGTSRFAEDDLNQTRLSDVSQNSKFIYPKEHAQTLKSPLATPKAKKEKKKKKSTFDVIEKEKVHFNNAQKYSELNKSNVLDGVYILGTSHRKNSTRVMQNDGRVSPNTLKLMLIKPNPGIKNHKARTKFLYFNK